MKNKTLLLSLIMVTAIVLTACGGGEETRTSVPATDFPTMQATEATTSTAETPSGTETLTSDLTGTPGIPVTGGENPARLSNELDFHVWNQNGEEIGEVKDMVIDVDNAMITYVVVGTGGFLGVGDKDVIVPWNMLTLQTGDGSMTGGQQNAFILQGDANTFNDFPDMDWKSTFPKLGEPAGDWDADIRAYWETGTVPGGTGTGTQSPEGTSTSAPDTTGTTVPNGTETPSTGTGGTGGTGLATSTATTNQGQNNGQGLGLGTKLQGVLLATDVLGSTVKLPGLPDTGQPGTGTGTTVPESTATSSSSTTTESTATPGGTTSTEATATLSTGQSNSNNGNALGNDNMALTISDMIVNVQTGDIQYIVVSSTFGDGEHWIPVPLGLLQWDATNQEFSLNTNGNMLTNAPFFTEDQFPSTDTTGWDSQFSTYWNNGGTGTGSGNGSGGNATATATP
ncbi:MAG: PRC-barrel domain-containing protein [Anaerolineales bacterium]